MDHYSVNAAHCLAFSTDTVSFDTVFTTVGSTTHYFMIYNRNSEDLKIRRIALAGGAGSNFRINVDGRRGDSFDDIPIWRKDSLYVAVEVTVDPNDADRPFVIYDSVIFMTNGTRQSVLLEAYGQNVCMLRGGTVFEADRRLTAERPYVVYDSVVIREGVVVTVDRGASFYMHHRARWRIDGRLVTNGTQEEPVVFRGDRLNRFSTYPPISYDQLPSQWEGLFFEASSFDNELNYTLIRNGVSGLTLRESTPERRKLTIRQSQVRNMDGNVLTAVNCDVEAINTEFSNAGECLLRLEGGRYRFVHCTMANFMHGSLISNRSARLTECLTLSDRTTSGEEEKVYPLLEAFFDNCVIDGDLPADTLHDYDWEVRFLTDSALRRGDELRFNYRFNHCVVKTKAVDNPRFHEVLFLKPPRYNDPEAERMRYVKGDGRFDDDFYDYVYDFRPARLSVGIGKADRAVSEQYPVDRYGVNRLSGGEGPSIGAYEYVPQLEEDEKR